MIPVTSNAAVNPSYIANENFKADSVVDVKPYVPENWHPDYTSIGLPTQYQDSTGFVLTRDTALTFYANNATTYPVSCRLAPYTNMEWKNYSFSGSITKPIGSEYDTATVGVCVYASDANSGYKITFEKDGVYIDGGMYSHQSMGVPRIFNGGDTLRFNITVNNLTQNNVSESIVRISVKTGINNNALSSLWSNLGQEDNSEYRIKNGMPRIFIDNMYNGNANCKKVITILKAQVANVTEND